MMEGGGGPLFPFDRFLQKTAEFSQNQDKGSAVLYECHMRYWAHEGARLRGRTLRGDVLGTFWKPPSPF